MEGRGDNKYEQINGNKKNEEMREKHNGMTQYWQVLILSNGKGGGRDINTINENHEKNNFLCYYHGSCTIFTHVPYLPEYTTAPFHNLKFSGRYLYRTF